MNNIQTIPLKTNILIIDDNITNLQLLSKILKKRGYDVISIADGENAINAAISELPDLILLDIMMPNIDGYEVCKQLKLDQRTQDIPVIFISALYEELDKVKAFEVGGVDYITKPLQIQEVLARIENQLRIRLLQKQLIQQNTQLQNEIKFRQKSEEKFAKAFRSSPDSMAICTLAEGRYIEVNDSFCQMTGYDREEVIGTTGFTLGMGVNLKKIVTLKQLLKKDGLIRNLEFQYRTKLGENRTGLLSAEIIELNGETCILGVTKDITDRQLAQKELQERAKIDNLLSIISRFFINYDLNDAINFTLQAIGEFMESDRGYIMRYLDQKLVPTHQWNHQDINPLVKGIEKIAFPCQQWIEQQISQGNILEISTEADLANTTEVIKLELKKKSIQSLLIVPMVNGGNTIGYLGLDTVRSCKNWQDREIKFLQLVGEIIAIASGRHEAEIALRESQHFIQRITDSSPNILYLYDTLEKRNIYTNRQISPILGYTPAEVQTSGARFLNNLIHPEDRARITQYYQQIETGADGDIFEIEYRFKHHNGTWRWISSRDTVFSRTDQGKVRQILGTITDITQSKQAAEELAQRVKQSGLNLVLV